MLWYLGTLTVKPKNHTPIRLSLAFIGLLCGLVGGARETSALPPAAEPGNVPYELAVPLGSWHLDRAATLKVVHRTAKTNLLAPLQTSEKAADTKSVLGLRFELPLSAGVDRTSWKLDAEALRSHDRELAEAATALRLSLNGQWQGVGVEAKVEQVEGDFRDPEAGKAEAGRRAQLRLSRKEKEWHLSATARVAGADEAKARAARPTSTDYRVVAGRVLPGNFRSSLRWKHASQANRDTTDMTLALRRRFDAVDVGVEHRNARIDRAGRTSATRKTGLDVKLGKGPWRWVGGTSLEERGPANGRVTEVQRWFLAPQWKGSGDQLQLRLRVGLDREAPPGRAEVQRLLGKTSVIWKLRATEHDADLRFDLSLSRTDRATQADVLDRRAALRLSYRFWS